MLVIEFIDWTAYKSNLYWFKFAYPLHYMVANDDIRRALKICLFHVT